jgi:preprotein translocase subunit SecA
LRQENWQGKKLVKQEQQKAAPIIDFSQAKNLFDGKKEIDSLSRYFKVLSFSELIEETTQLIEQLNREGSTDEIIRKSKVILKELGLRLTNSHGLSKSFLKMKDDLEERLQSR